MAALPNTDPVVDDVAGVEYMSSAGAWSFVNGRLSCREEGGDLILLNPTPVVEDVLDLLAVRDDFKVIEDVNEADKAFN